MQVSGVASPRICILKSRAPPYALSVDLGDIGQSLGKNVAWHLVAILVSELGGLALCSLGESSGVGDGACHDTADRGGYLEDV